MYNYITVTVITEQGEINIKQHTVCGGKSVLWWKTHIYKDSVHI